MKDSVWNAWKLVFKAAWLTYVKKGHEKALVLANQAQEMAKRLMDK